jgi:hypothetical protein
LAPSKKKVDFFEGIFALPASLGQMPPFFHFVPLLFLFRRQAASPRETGIAYLAGSLTHSHYLSAPLHHHEKHFTTDHRPEQTTGKSGCSRPPAGN